MGMGHANKVYVWVGGSPSTPNAVDRFSWNTPGNWVIRYYTGDVNPITYNYVATSEIPKPGDLVSIGAEPGVTLYYDYLGGMSSTPVIYRGNDLWKVNAPLLFGGFSGSVSGGQWLNGLSGTTWSSSLQGLEIGTDPLETYFNIPAFQFSYPFNIIGGGITYSVVQTLKSLNIEGMSDALWDSILANRTQTQEKGLILKTDYLSVNTTSGQVRQLVGITGPYNGAISVGNGLWIKLKLVDNFGYAWGTGSNWIKTQITGRIYQTQLNFIDSAIDSISLKSTGKDISVNGRPSDSKYSDSSNSLVLDNVVVKKIDFSESDLLYNLKFSNNCVFNTIFCPCYLPDTRTGDSELENKPKKSRKIEGTIDPYAVYKRLNNGTNWTGATLNSSVEIRCSDNKYKLCPDLILGKGFKEGLTHSGNVIVGDNISISRYNVIMEPGVYIQTLTLNGYAHASRTIPDSLSNIYIKTIKINQGAVLDLYTTGREVWKIGVVSGITLTGGISVQDSFYDQGQIIGGNNTRLLNYIVVNNINKRTLLEQQPPDLGASDTGDVNEAPEDIIA